MIKEYFKDGKRYYEIVGEYIGKHPITGKEKRVKKKGFKTKKEANLYIAKVKLEFESNASILPDNITFGKLWELWYERKKYQIADASMNTLNNQRDKHILPFLGHIQVKKITPLLLQDHFNKNLAPHFATATMTLTKTFIKDVLEYAVDLDLLVKNPAKKLEVPKTTKREAIFLEKNKLNEFLEVCRSTLSKKYYIYIRLLALTGARKGEIGALEWSDIDFVNCSIDINKTITKDVKGKKIFGVTTKRLSSKRVLQIDRETMELLLELKNTSKILSKNIFSINNYIYVSYCVKRCAKKIGVENFRAHDLRHTHATLLCEAGVDIKTVQERMGHSKIETTLAIYAKVTSNQRNQVVDTFMQHIS